MEDALGDDRDLWERSLAGDDRAFTQIFDRHRNRVFAHACRLVDGFDYADDVTVAAFLELWRRRRNVRLVEGSLAPWLLVTAGNLARNQTRATRRYRGLLSRLPHAVDQPDPFEVMLTRDLGLDPGTRSALRALAETDLHLFCLVVFEDYTPAEAAEVLGISLSAARSRLHRTRHRLREALRENHPRELAGGARKDNS